MEARRLKKIRSINSVVIYTLILVFALRVLAGPEDDRQLKLYAERIVSSLLLLKSQNLLHGPFFLAIDGPPGVGKSSLANPLKNLLSEVTQKIGITLKVGTFRQDAFLRKRADRKAEFEPEHGIGISGNCDGREYRWEALLACIKRVCHARDFYGYEYRSGSLHGPVRYDYSGFDLLIFEGTHSTGESLFPYMHFTIYLGADPLLIRHNRLERGVRENRDWDTIVAMANVAESQYPTCLDPNSARAQVVFYLKTTEKLPPDQELREGNTPSFKRELTILRSPLTSLAGLSPEHLEALQALMSSGILTPVNNNLNTTIVAAPARFWKQLIDILKAGKYKLSIPARDNSCFFSALASAYPSLGVLSREDAVALLLELQTQISQGLLSPIQQRIIDQVHAILESEIEFISDPHGWGGLTTIMYLWAASLGSDSPPSEPIYLIARIGAEIVIIALQTDGSVTEQQTLPVCGNAMVYDGGTHWMWAQNHGFFLTQESSDSGFGGSTDGSSNNLKDLPLKDVKHALCVLLIAVLTKMSAGIATH